MTNANARDVEPAALGGLGEDDGNLPRPRTVRSSAPPRASAFPRSPLLARDPIIPPVASLPDARRLFQPTTRHREAGRRQKSHLSREFAKLLVHIRQPGDHRKDLPLLLTGIAGEPST